MNQAPLQPRIAPGSAHVLLKRATTAAHDALSDAPPMQALMQEQVSREDYIAVLQAFIPMHRTLEPSIARTARWESGLCGERLQALESDLRVLQINPRGVDEDPPPPAIDDPAQAMGACYVLEGSFLGGVVISQHLRRHLGEDIPLAYFGAQNIDVRLRWHSFLGRAERELSSAEARERALEGAQLCYHWIRDSFSRMT
jgi:heme oxygenase